ncbi:hypothetical protein Q5P01_009254 [Channa striata]|uniref:Uncharacterized protein n=1 Tax=Channa striata TaxID=64152 RepID=A0AA88N3P4_CHASR|nr:hypothetical protein Q5P01_009254 [Channa striata]
MEEEAVRNYCRLMIARVRDNQRQLDSSGVGERTRGHGDGRERRGTEPERRVVARHECGGRTEGNLPPGERVKRGRGRTALRVTCQGLEVQPVPVQLMLMLRIQTFKEDVKRAAEVELHDPSACRVCQRENASLALKSFIRRKKTQLQFQTLQARLNTLDLRSDIK